jgi:ABC-2 type transport system ATP-binding protein
MAGSALVIDEIVKYFPVPQTGVRAFLNPFAPLTHPALLGVSFQVGAGEVAGLIGANGSGKSTLLRVLATLLVPTRGHATVAGHDVERHAPQVRAQLGFHSATDGGFYSRLTARENLNFFAVMNNLFDAEAALRVDELTELMGMGDLLESQVRTLSTGQVHRLGLARAMIHRPSVLLLDEPTRSLDPMPPAEFRRLLKTQ